MRQDETPKELNESHKLGKHIGVCIGCGFSLLAEKNEECTKCYKPVGKRISDIL